MISTATPPRRDVYERKRLFDARSFTHHAKYNLSLVQQVIDAYSEPGDVLLDPMAGLNNGQRLRFLSED